MASVNKVILVGNLGSDPDSKFTPSGKQVVELSLATSFGSGDNTKTQWHRVVLWDKLADTASKYLSKGSPVYIEGRLEYRSYDDKEGNKRYVTEIVGQALQLLGKKGDAKPETTEDPF